MALATLVTASSCPTTRSWSASSQRSSLDASASVRLETGTFVMAETTSAMSCSLTTTMSLSSLARQASSSWSRLEVSFLLPVTEMRRLLVLLCRGGDGLLVLHVGEFGVHLGDLGWKVRAVDARAGTRLIDDVDGLVGQEAILHIAVGKRDGGLDGLVGVLDVVMLLVAVLQTANDPDGVLGRWLTNAHRLEAPLEGGVLLDVLAVLIGRGGTNDLNLATREGRLEDGCRIDGALGRPCTDDGMDFVDEEDVLVGLLELLDDLLHAVLELASILGTSHEAREVKRPDLLSAQDIGNVTRRDELGRVPRR